MRRVPHGTDEDPEWTVSGAVGVTVLEEGCDEIIKDSFGSKFQKPTSVYHIKWRGRWLTELGRIGGHLMSHPAPVTGVSLCHLLCWSGF